MSSCRRCCIRVNRHTELNLNVIGDDVESGPWSLADGEISAMQSKVTRKYADRALRCEGRWNNDVLRPAFDGQGTRHCITLIA